MNGPNKGNSSPLTVSSPDLSGGTFPREFTCDGSGAVPTNVRLLEPPVASPKGTVYLRYGLADGTPETRDMSAPDRRAGEA